MTDATGWRPLLDSETTETLVDARKRALAAATDAVSVGYRAAARILTRALRDRGVCPDCGTDQHTDHPGSTP